MEIKENERLAVLETNVTNIATDMRDMKADIREIKDAVVNIPVTDHEKRIANLEKAVRDARKRNWIQMSLSAVFGSIMTFLVIFFLQNIRL